MDFLIKAAQLLLSLSILIVLHEFGHFLPARWFGIRVEKFYLFFDWPRHLFKRKIGETEFGIGMLPLGGYVKISGMIDESMDKEQMQKPAESWEFRAKPAWQRLIIMLGGVTVNLILGCAIYIMILFVWGRAVMPADKLPYGIHPSATMTEAGMRDGDVILAVEGKKPESIDMAVKEIMIDDARRMEVLRGGGRVMVLLPSNISEQALENGDKELFSERFPFYVANVAAGGDAERAGILKNDRIIAVNGTATPYFNDCRSIVTALEDTLVRVKVERQGQEIEIPTRVGDGVIGVAAMGFDSLIARGHPFVLVKKKYGLLASIPAGIGFGIEKLGSYVRSLKLLFTSSGAKQIGGFGAIGNMFPADPTWVTFWELTAFLSIMLAFMNVLPIPALDGGHVMFLLYEMVARRPASQKVMEWAQMAGMAFLVCLLLFANGNDVYKWIIGK